MKNQIKFLTLITLSASLFFIACSTSKESSSPNKKTQLENLSGTYSSAKVEDWGNGTFGHRTFLFEGGKWSLKFILALDPDLKMQVFQFRTHGSYTIQDQSTVVDNAYNALFLEDQKLVTLKTQDEALIKAFGLADCDLTYNVEKDISVNGCAIWPSVEACHEDYDLLSLDEEGGLYFGVRPADNNMCTPERRPTALLPAVIKK